MRALVFGGARYVGAHVVTALRQHGHEVAVIDFPDPTAPDEDPDFAPRVRAQLVSADVSAVRSARLDFEIASFDAVLFCGVEGYSASAEPAISENYLAAERAMLERIVAERPRALVLQSSTAVYATADQPSLDESAPLSAPDGIAGHILELEAMAKTAAEQHGIALTVLRCSIISGAKPGTTYYGRSAKLGYLLPGLRVTSAAYPTVSAELTGTGALPGHNVMDFVHVGDAATAFLLAATAAPNGPAAGALYNVSGGSRLPVEETLEAVRTHEAMRLDASRGVPAEALPGSAVSHGAIERDLGWRPSLPVSLITTNEVAHFVNLELVEKNIGFTTRVSNEFLGSRVTSDHLVIYGVLFVLDRAGDFSNDNITFEVGGTRYPAEILTKRGLAIPFQSVRMSPYRLKIPLEDVRGFPIQNPIRIVYVTPDGHWFRRRIRYSLLRRKPRHAHGRLHYIAQSDSTLYVRQAGDNFCYITLRARIVTDRIAMSPVIHAARIASLLRHRPRVLLYEKESSRYEESASVVFERLIDSGRTDVRYVLAPERLNDVPEKYRPYVVPRFSFAHLYHFFCARTFIGTEAVAHAAELRTAHRAFLKKLFSNDYDYVFLQHGVMYMVALSSTQRSPFRAGGTILPPGTKIVVSSEREARHFVDLGGFEPGDLYVSGLPKFDRATRVADADRILIMPTWRPWEHNVVRADPTNAPYYKMLVELFDSIPDHLKDKTSILPHPLLTQVLGQTELRERMWSEGSYDDALRQGAILITDYSSIAYDAFYRGANVIFWWKEKDACMQRYGGHLMLEEDTAFGPVCYEASTLTRLIAQNYRTPQDRTYVERYREIVTFHDGKNTERLLELIERDGLL